MKAVGVHVYAGGFAVGVQKYFDIEAHFEEMDAGLEVFQDNFPKSKLHFSEPKDWPLKEYRDVDLMYANPPCAPWSQSAGKRWGGLTDPRLEYTFNSAQAGLAVRPKIFIYESVSKVMTRGKPVVDELTLRYHGAGYKVTHFVTDAALHGVPQYRERFHFIAHQVELADIPISEEMVSTRDAIGDLQDVDPDGTVEGHDFYEADRSIRPLFEHMVQGEDAYRCYLRRREVDPAIAEGPKPSMLYKRPRYDLPSNTLVAVHRLVHPELPRMMTVREAARLCEYPDTFTFRASGRRWPHDPAQAVTPGMGKVLGDLAFRSLIQDVPAERNPDSLEQPQNPDSLIDLRPTNRAYRRERLKDWKENNDAYKPVPNLYTRATPA